MYGMQYAYRTLYTTYPKKTESIYHVKLLSFVQNPNYDYILK